MVVALKISNANEMRRVVVVVLGGVSGCFISAEH